MNLDLYQKKCTTFKGDTPKLKYEEISENLSNINVSYKSYCGGVPAEANDFKYKFSW